MAARGDYNRAVGRIFGVLREGKLTPGAGPVKVGPRTLTWRKEARKEWNPALYELIPAGQLKIGGTYLKEREIKDGLGVPLVAKREADRAHDYAPTPHFFYAATGMARFEGSRCVLSMEDPIQTETVKVGGGSRSLGGGFHRAAGHDARGDASEGTGQTAPAASGKVCLHHPHLETGTLRSGQNRGAGGAWPDVVARHVVSDAQPPAG